MPWMTLRVTLALAVDGGTDPVPVTVKLKVPAREGVPLNTPLAVLMESPGGTEPERLQTTWVDVLLYWNAWLYPRPVVPSLRLVFAMLAG